MQSRSVLYVYKQSSVWLYSHVVHLMKFWQLSHVWNTSEPQKTPLCCCYPRTQRGGRWHRSLFLKGAELKISGKESADVFPKEHGAALGHVLKGLRAMQLLLTLCLWVSCGCHAQKSAFHCAHVQSSKSAWAQTLHLWFLFYILSDFSLQGEKKKTNQKAKDFILVNVSKCILYIKIKNIS